MSDSLKPNASSPATLGFLTIIQDSSGWVGGYLITNSWGRPLEFRLTSAVQPNRVQTVLYGPTLTEYLHADLIGKALVEKTALKSDLIVTDCPTVLSLRSRVDVPVVVVQPIASSQSDAGEPFTHARSSHPLRVHGRYAADVAAIQQILDRIDPAVDLAEPFTRIQDAVIEARKMGVTNRAA